MKKNEFVTQDLLSKTYQHSEGGLCKLPPERQLAEECFTVRQALEKLASIGVVRIVQGLGAWIHEQARNNPLVLRMY